MILDYDSFQRGYLGKRDNWQIGINLLPFVTNSSLKFNKQTGINGLTGVFFRNKSYSNAKPITDFTKSLYQPVYNYLKNEKQMPEQQIKIFGQILKDLFWQENHFNIIDTNFLKYIPILPEDEEFPPKDIEKYKDGINNLAEYICAFPSSENLIDNAHDINNLILSIVCDALDFGQAINPEKKKNKSDYTILPFIKESFIRDVAWFAENKEEFKVKNISLFLHFYICYSMIQTATKVNIRKIVDINKPTEFYFLYDSEKASANHEAVTKGWSYHITYDIQRKLFGIIQALDISNTILGKNIGFRLDVLNKLNETPFCDNKTVCEKILRDYQEKARYKLEHRPSEKNKPTWPEIDVTVNTYEEFLEKLNVLCVTLQSESFSRIGSYLKEVAKIRFLQKRRNYEVLVLDNEMLLFLIALFSKKKNGECIKLENLYQAFNSYGIFFNKLSRDAIEEYLLKLNLLDKKSDAGEAQYVRIIL